MVAKDIFSFATVFDGCKEVNFIELSNLFNFLCEQFKEMVSKMSHSWENPMNVISLQPSVMVAKRKISIATMTDACDSIYENGLTSENQNLPMNLA